MSGRSARLVARWRDEIRRTCGHGHRPSLVRLCSSIATIASSGAGRSGPHHVTEIDDLQVEIERPGRE
jgi:hypothetical protein